MKMDKKRLPCLLLCVLVLSHMSILDTIKQNAINLAKQAYYNHEYRKNTGTSKSHNTVSAVSNLLGSSPVLGVGTNQPQVSYTPSSSGATRDLNGYTTGASPQPDVLGANTGGGNTGGGGNGGGNIAPPNGDPNSGEYQDWARIEEEKKRARMNAIISRLNLMKEEANRLRGSAKTQYDFTGEEIGKNYGSLKDLATAKRGSSLDALTQEDVGVQNMYGRLGGNTRRAVESAMLQNRMLARAMGSLGAGTYEDSQVNTRNMGMNSLNDSALEEADKRAGIKGRTSETVSEFDNIDTQIASEEASLKQKALTDYNNAIANADLMEKGYGIDSEEALQTAEAEFSSALNGIRDYIQNKSLKLAEIAATNQANTSGTINSYNPINPTLASTLGNTSAYDSAGKTIENISTSPSGTSVGGAGSNYTAPTLTERARLIAEAQRKKELEQLGYFNQNLA